MSLNSVTFQNSGYFSKLIIDYLNQEKSIASLYNRFPTIENFKKQIEEKELNFPTINRQILHRVLTEQYSKIKPSNKTLNNINALSDSNTYTITTGHQLNLFTGPLYFLYKIISTINLSEKLNISYPGHHFVPVYWMATEDHDFEEINHFMFEEKVICWNKDSKGPVGRLDTKGLEKVLEVFKSHIGLGNNAQKIIKLFEQAYLNNYNLAEATRFLANELFGDYGLVIIDGDHRELKQLFSPYIEKELIYQRNIIEVEKSFNLLKEYTIQVNPREINLFYITDKLRERIVYQNDIYKVNNTSIEFKQDEILEELKKYPERFSPNVILRPLYQEVILPNLCYIGGGGELAYWFELKQMFNANEITFPILLLRNSVLLINQKQRKKAEQLNLTWQDLFKKADRLIHDKTQELSQIQFNFNKQKEFLNTQFEELKTIAQQTDKSFIGAVLAQEAKQLKGLNNLEKRLKKAEKKNHKEQLGRITLLHTELFPNNNLQERVVNFSEFYKECGDYLIEKLFQKLNPLNHEFDVLVL
ncbi:bacillithiol biosynthesis cysteine-adding enzyme BshC [Myroides indicus]|uniref:Putative cysteine ligase BshC n=1 Tax=Myroides indicus TaxID=1323422 RepID=A0A4V3E8G8_9FLAO|nr:bacillithiol biosynthesis cysteine-adding enzyme BshC [Myroides indicus]TDS57527.1 bacillithiol biosynthesis cysteine-adding enzyme BshC [Myroides indicus]